MPPPQWLSSQKMEGLLARWALATQEFDFTIKYHKGVEHGNADALSRQHSDHNAAIGHVAQNVSELKHQQLQNPVLCQLRDALLKSQVPSRGLSWSHPPLRRYRQLWS